MKKTLTGGLIALMVLFLSTGLSLAGNGKGQGAGNGTGPIHDIFAGTPFTYTGEVVSLASGEGLLIATDSENIVVYGIGPVKYWEAEAVLRPVVGDTVTVEGYAVDYNGELRNIAVTITVGEDELQLRDLETGVPLWRQSGWGQNQK